MPYAKKTKVPVSQTRGEIDKLLRAWGADMIRWTDIGSQERVSLEFLWQHDGDSYLARFAMDVEGGAQPEHRLLLLWLKASFNSIEAGLVSAETIFLPFLVGQDGQTVADVALPKMRTMLTAGALEMLQLSRGD